MAKMPTQSPAALLAPDRPLTLSNVADGAEGLVISDLARAVAARINPPATSALVICRDGPRMAALGRALSFFAPDIEVLQFPAWDCLPYDRVSPHGGVVAQRMTVLSRLARIKGRAKPAVLLTTVNAALQRVPARDLIGKQALSAAPGNVLGMDGIIRWLELNGFNRASTVREFGDYAVRGGILDLFASGMDLPVRLDFFGDTLESIRSFDPETQRTVMEMRALDLVPVSEFQLTTDTIRKFRTGYVAAFGAADPEDMLYEAVSEGRRHPGMEHWLPLFHDKLDTLFDYVPGAPVILEAQAEDVARERLSQIKDYYEARKDALADKSGPLYKPLPPDRLYLPEAEWSERLNTAALARLTPFAVPDQSGSVADIGARAGHNFSAERANDAAGVFDAVGKHALALQAGGKRVIVALWSEGARERMKHVLAEHGLHNLTPAGSWPEALALPRPQVALVVLGLEGGFETADIAVISEQDILGDRLVGRGGPPNQHLDVRVRRRPGVFDLCTGDARHPRRLRPGPPRLGVAAVMTALPLHHPLSHHLDAQTPDRTGAAMTIMFAVLPTLDTARARDASLATSSAHNTNAYGLISPHNPSPTRSFIQTAASLMLPASVTSIRIGQSPSARSPGSSAAFRTPAIT